MTSSEDDSWKQAMAPLQHIPSAKERAVPQFQVAAAMKAFFESVLS